jgi:hypothetical protein
VLLFEIIRLMAAGICFMFGIYENQITKLTNMLPAFHYEIIRKKE